MKSFEITKAPVAILGIVVALALALALSSAPHARSAASDITGYAWSDNIGWVSFGDGSTYGLSVDSGGNVTGYAWGDSIGWIRPAQGAECPGTGAKLISGVFTGWLRALNTGGDGCISLSGSGYQATTASNSGYNNPTDYAWGSDTVGWLSVNASGGSCATSITCTDSTHFASYTDNSCVVQPAGACGAGLVCVNGFGCTNAPAAGCISIGVDVRSSGSCAAAVTNVRVPKNGNKTLYWSAQNVSSCTVTGNGQAPQSGLSGTMASGAITAATTFTLACSGATGGGTWTATINILPSFKEL